MFIYFLYIYIFICYYMLISFTGFFLFCVSEDLKLKRYKLLVYPCKYRNFIAIHTTWNFSISCGSFVLFKPLGQQFMGEIDPKIFVPGDSFQGFEKATFSFARHLSHDVQLFQMGRVKSNVLPTASVFLRS